MIRINLLAVDQATPSKLPKLSIPDLGQQATLICVLVLAGTLAGIGWWFWSLRTQAQALEQELVAAKAESERLRSVLQQVERFEKRRDQLQERVTLIEQLRAGQMGPVHLLDEISRSLPERLWLLEMKQQGVDVTLRGQASTLTSLAEFVANLESSGQFTRPVEILDSQVEQSKDAGDLVNFAVKAQFQTPALIAEKAVKKGE